MLGDLAINHIIPAAVNYQGRLLDNLYKVNQLFDPEKASKIGKADYETVEKISDHINEVKSLVTEMTESRKKANAIESMRQKAITYHDNVAPVMEKIRYHIDHLELMVDNEIWPLPKYREMLFIR